MNTTLNLVSLTPKQALEEANAGATLHFGDGYPEHKDTRGVGRLLAVDHWDSIPFKVLMNGAQSWFCNCWKESPSAKEPLSQYVQK